MSNSKPADLQLEVDPWAKKARKSTPSPNDLRLACIYELDVVIDSIPEAACFRRTETHDELWIASLEYPISWNSYPDIAEYAATLRLAVRALSHGESEDAACFLFGHLARSRTGFSGPRKLYVEGLIDEHNYYQSVYDVEIEHLSNKSAALEEESSIIEVARFLELSPEPSGTSPTAWQATCPGSNGKHQLLICTESNTFGCGYCERKGGPIELEEFVESSETTTLELVQKDSQESGGESTNHDSPITSEPPVDTPPPGPPADQIRLSRLMHELNSAEGLSQEMQEWWLNRY